MGRSWATTNHAVDAPAVPAPENKSLHFCSLISAPCLGSAKAQQPDAKFQSCLSSHKEPLNQGGGRGFFDAVAVSKQHLGSRSPRARRERQSRCSFQRSKDPEQCDHRGRIIYILMCLITARFDLWAYSNRRPQAGVSCRMTSCCD